MQTFSDIKVMAENHKGKDAIESLLINPLTANELKDIPADRWLSAMSKCVFQAGFSWKVVENKWDRFEEVFFGFDVNRCAMMHDEELEDLAREKGIIANHMKMRSIRDNANYLSSLTEEHGSVGSFYASWKINDYCDNILAMRKNGYRLGGKTGQIALRRLGVDTLVFSNDVLGALRREGVCDKMPTSKKAFVSLKNAIDTWVRESGLPLNHISQILAFSVI